MLFERALRALDSASAGIQAQDWSFGGGTVLMRRYRHRLSRDVDIFVPDPQLLGYLDPDLNETVESLTADRVKGPNYLKLSFAEGEIDFIAAGPVTADPRTIETILGRQVGVETSAEIVGKKIRYRASAFTARDVLDLAMIIEKEPKEICKLGDLLRLKRDVILARFESGDRILRTTFSELELLDYRRTYDECLEIVKKQLRK